jgi:putative addiction module component (TIGR02574 family)
VKQGNQIDFDLIERECNTDDVLVVDAKPGGGQMATAQELVREIEKLSPSERVRLIDRVIRETIKPDPEIESIWVKEAEARWAAFERGEVKAVPYESVLAKYRQKP